MSTRLRRQRRNRRIVIVLGTILGLVAWYGLILAIARLLFGVVQ